MADVKLFNVNKVILCLELALATGIALT